jgi:hypothetical protein
VILREEYRLKVFENRVLRRIFGPKWDEVTGGWRQLHNEELHDLYCSPSVSRIIQSKRMRWAHAPCGANEEEGKTPLGRPRRRWVDNIKMIL